MSSALYMNHKIASTETSDNCWPVEYRQSSSATLISVDRGSMDVTIADLLQRLRFLLVVRDRHGRGVHASGTGDRECLFTLNVILTTTWLQVEEVRVG